MQLYPWSSFLVVKDEVIRCTPIWTEFIQLQMALKWNVVAYCRPVWQLNFWHRVIVIISSIHRLISCIELHKKYLKEKTKLNIWHRTVFLWGSLGDDDVYKDNSNEKILTCIYVLGGNSCLLFSSESSFGKFQLNAEQYCPTRDGESPQRLLNNLQACAWHAMTSPSIWRWTTSP